MLQSLNRWWKLGIGIFFSAAAVDRAINGGGTPGITPTVLYAMCGVGFLVAGLVRQGKILRRTAKADRTDGPRPAG